MFQLDLEKAEEQEIKLPTSVGSSKKQKNSRKPSTSNNTRDDSTHGHHQRVNTEIRLLIFFAVDGEAIYSQQKQDLAVTTFPVS